MIVIGDTSGMLALYNRSDPEHFATRRAADSASAIVISPLALTEIHHVATVRANRTVADSVLGAIADQVKLTRFVIPEVDASTLHTALKVRKAYEGLDLDLVDATCVVLADTFDTPTILTHDHRDFRALRPLRKYPAFELLPADMT